MDGAYSVALDSSGNPIISGVTESENFPTTRSALQPHRNAYRDQNRPGEKTPLNMSGTSESIN